MMKKAFFAFILSICISPIFGQTAHPASCSTYEFHYEDIEHFREVLEVAKNNGDTLNAIKNYFAKGSEGMKAWIERYSVKPERILKAIRYFPGYYEYLSTIDSALKTYEAQITKGLDGLKKLYPSTFVHIPPVYYFILFSGGGSVEMTANMISIDYFGYHKDLDESEFDRIGGLFPKGKFPLVNVKQVPHVAVHETAHLLQSYIQGEYDYVSIYEDEQRTILSYLIREGGADFLTYLGAGIIDSTKWGYGEKHERELWESIQPILDQDPNEHPGWFSGKSPEHPDWPFQIGYYLGHKMVEYFYDESTNKKEALDLILYSHKEEDFRKFIEKYRQKWE